MISSSDNLDDGLLSFVFKPTIMKIPYLIILFLIISSSLSFAQNQIQGNVIDENGEAVSFANVILNSAMDSSMVKLEYTGDDGEFIIQGINNGDYQLIISYVGYKEQVTSITLSGEDIKLKTIELEVVSNELSEVTVSAIRPILEVKPDKLVFNVEGSVNAQGNDGLELLRILKVQLLWSIL